eukprot:365013-Chlamydomonas_euryale.AAC.8
MAHRHGPQLERQLLVREALEGAPMRGAWLTQVRQALLNVMVHEARPVACVHGTLHAARLLHTWRVLVTCGDVVDAWRVVAAAAVAEAMTVEVALAVAVAVTVVVTLAEELTVVVAVAVVVVVLVVAVAAAAVAMALGARSAGDGHDVDCFVLMPQTHKATTLCASLSLFISAPALAARPWAEDVQV